MNNENVSKIIEDMMEEIKQSFENISLLGEKRTKEYEDEIREYQEELFRLQGSYRTLDKLNQMICKVEVE